MAKIKIDGETFDYDGARQPVSEALWIESVYKRRYVEWQADLVTGEVKAFVMLACLVWRRDGRDVATAFDDIIAGRRDFDLNEMLTSMREAEAEAAAAAEQEAAGEDPTTSGEPSAPDGTPTTGTGTSGSSPTTSASGPGKSASSKSRTSRR